MSSQKPAKGSASQTQAPWVQVRDIAAKAQAKTMSSAFYRGWAIKNEAGRVVVVPPPNIALELGSKVDLGSLKGYANKRETAWIAAKKFIEGEYKMRSDPKYGKMGPQWTRVEDTPSGSRRNYGPTSGAEAVRRMLNL